MNQHSANLKAAIADLRRRRAEIDTAIASMEAILASVYGDTGAPSPSAPAPRPLSPPAVSLSGLVFDEGEIPLSRAEKVRKVFDEWPDEVWTTTKLAKQMGDEPDENTIKAISAILSRLRAAQVVARVGRGAYRSKNASAPGATGAEESGESTSDSPLQEGGSDYDSETSDGRGDLAHNALGSHGHGDHRAAIGGS